MSKRSKGVKLNEKISTNIIQKYTQNVDGMDKVIEETKMENESSCDGDCSAVEDERRKSIELTEDRILSTNLANLNKFIEDPAQFLQNNIIPKISNIVVPFKEIREPVTEPKVEAISLNSTPFSMTTDSAKCMIQVNPQEVPQKETIGKSKHKKWKLVKRKRANNKSKLKRNTMLA